MPQGTVSPSLAGRRAPGPRTEAGGDEEGTAVVTRLASGRPETAHTTGSGGSAFDEDGPPLDVIVADEAGIDLLSGAAPKAAPPIARLSDPDPDSEKLPTPPLDTLIERIPGAVRELMDELFRARFVKVTRVPPSVLKAR